jgi:hypothetical protein
MDEIYIDALIANCEEGKQANDSAISKVLESLYEDFSMSPYESEVSSFKDQASTYQEVTQKLQTIDTSTQAGRQTAIRYLKEERRKIEAYRQKAKTQTYEIKGAELIQDQSEYFGDPTNHKGLKSLTFNVQAVLFDPTAKEGHQYSLINSVERRLVVPYPSQDGQRFMTLQSANITLDEGQNNAWNTSQQNVEAKLQSIQSSAK